MVVPHCRYVPFQKYGSVFSGVHTSHRAPGSTPRTVKTVNVKDRSRLLVCDSGGQWRVKQAEEMLSNMRWTVLGEFDQARFHTRSPDTVNKFMAAMDASNNRGPYFGAANAAAGPALLEDQ